MKTFSQEKFHMFGSRLNSYKEKKKILEDNVHNFSDQVIPKILGRIGKNLVLRICH